MTHDPAPVSELSLPEKILATPLVGPLAMVCIALGAVGSIAAGFRITFAIVTWMGN